MDERQNNLAVQTEAASAVQEAAQNEKNRPVGFWPFVGLIVLFSVPVIGWIAALIFLLASKNKNIKNFSGAHLAVTTVQCIASFLVSVLLFSAVFGMILPIINQALGTSFESFSQMISSDDLPSGKYSKMLARYTPTIVAIIGEEYRPFLKELSCGKYEELLERIAHEKYASVHADFENGKYPKLTEKLSAEDYGFLMGELKKEADGGDSEFFDFLEDFLP